MTAPKMVAAALVAPSPKTCVPFPKTRVLVVEDEPDIARLIQVNLDYSGFQTVLVADGVAARREMDTILPDVILLDWMLPGQSGLDLAKQWRAQERTKDIPMLMLTAKSEERDKVSGLENGVDDYITKPFSPRELVARIRAVLRRRSPERLDDHVSIGKLSLDAGQHTVMFGSREIKPGPTEFRLLHYLMKHPGRVHSRAQLLDKVWGDHVFIEERTVDVHIKRLREALDIAGFMVETVRGVGYRFATSSDLPKLTKPGK
ncbi:MAG: phosphate regulon transcriptional regulator PhoB [Zoogloeaceae bacterium]|jgi:two-component system phosphate regulon response regulator PhoB|nr:phosphate regulon transcriptional regulator PhoB [Zoogloeaceae bacterium]